jgi:hypothetical protein
MAEIVHATPIIVKYYYILVFFDDFMLATLLPAVHSAGYSSEETDLKINLFEFS